MAEKKNPTNSDLYRQLGQIDTKVDQIHTQVRATNGRLKVVEKWKNDLEVRTEAVEEYKRTHPDSNGNQPSQTPQQQLKEDVWSQREKTLTVIITSLIAIIAAVVGGRSL